MEDVETDLQSQYDIQVETAFEDLVKRWAGPATEQIPMENLARIVNPNDPPLTLVINLERNITLDSGATVPAGAPVDFDFVINRRIRRGGNNNYRNDSFIQSRSFLPQQSVPAAARIRPGGN